MSLDLPMHTSNLTQAYQGSLRIPFATVKGLVDKRGAIAARMCTSG